MDILKIVLTIVFAIDCIALIALVLLQEGKESGLGAIGGGNDTYWGKNKGRSKEGNLVMATRIATVVFIVLAIVLNLSVFNA